MPSIPVDVLRAFVAVVEARGFTRAAEEFGRSQPTISLQVKRLEELVEAPLFDKAARFELTPVGAVCFDYGKRLLRLHDDMLDEASRARRPIAMLRIGSRAKLAARLARDVSGGCARRDDRGRVSRWSPTRPIPLRQRSDRTRSTLPSSSGPSSKRRRPSAGARRSAGSVRRRRTRGEELRCLSRSRRRDRPCMRRRSRLCEPKDASSSSCA